MEILLLAASGIVCFSVAYAVAMAFLTVIPLKKVENILKVLFKRKGKDNGSHL